MSAFEVSDTHIDALITAGLKWHTNGVGPMRWYYGNPTMSGELRFDNAGSVGAMLLAENRRSVNYRYREDEIESPYLFTMLHGGPDPVVVLKAIQCFEYQACETPDYRDSEAYAFCRTLMAVAHRQLPGYEQAPWEINSSAVFLVKAKEK